MSDHQELLRRRWCVCLLASCCCLLWGSAFPCIKIGYRLFQISSEDTASQILFAGVRFTLAGVLNVLWAWIAARRILLPKKGSWGKIGLLSIFQTSLEYLLFYASLAHTTGVRGSIIISSSVFFAILLASLLFRQETLTRTKGLGCLLGFAGVVLINLTDDMFSGGVTFSGEGFMVLAAVCSAAASVLFKRYAGTESASVLSGYQFLVGGLTLLCAGWLLGGQLRSETPLASTALILYMALLSAVAQTLWALLLRWNPVSRVTVYQFLTPVCGVLLSVLLLRENSQVPPLQCAAALVLVSGGILLLNRAPAPEPDSLKVPR